MTLNTKNEKKSSRLNGWEWVREKERDGFQCYIIWFAKRHQQCIRRRNMILLSITTLGFYPPMSWTHHHTPVFLIISTLHWLFVTYRSDFLYQPWLFFCKKLLSIVLIFYSSTYKPLTLTFKLHRYSDLIQKVWSFYYFQDCFSISIWFIIDCIQTWYMTLVWPYFKATTNFRYETDENKSFSFHLSNHTTFFNKLIRVVKSLENNKNIYFKHILLYLIAYNERLYYLK